MDDRPAVVLTGDRMLRADVVRRELLGGISRTCLWAWLRDPKLSFPRPVRIGNTVLYGEREIREWLERRRAEQAAAGQAA